MKKLILIMLGVVFLSSCASQPTISFEKAVDGITYALTELKKQTGTGKDFGLLPTEIDATFNISADKKGELMLAPINLIKDYKSTITTNKSNQITRV